MQEENASGSTQPAGDDRAIFHGPNPGHMRADGGSLFFNLLRAQPLVAQVARFIIFNRPSSVRHFAG